MDKNLQFKLFQIPGGSTRLKDRQTQGQKILSLPYNLLVVTSSVACKRHMLSLCQIWPSRLLWGESALLAMQWTQCTLYTV